MVKRGPAGRYTDRAESVVTIPPPDNAVARRLGQVVQALVDGDRQRAGAALKPLVGVTCRTHPIEPMPTLARESWPAGQGTRTRNPPITVVATVYVRDGFTCVYCGRWTIPTSILRLISTAFPARFPYHPNWPMASTPRAYWDISTSVDHVQAVSTGGDWQAAHNLATACARCQYQKSNLALSALGWTVRRDNATWDGLTTTYEALWNSLERPDPGHHLAWIRAFSRAHAKTPSA